jgi:hypothetical protein
VDRARDLKLSLAFLAEEACPLAEAGHEGIRPPTTTDERFALNFSARKDITCGEYTPDFAFRRRMYREIQLDKTELVEES